MTIEESNYEDSMNTSTGGHTPATQIQLVGVSAITPSKNQSTNLTINESSVQTDRELRYGNYIIFLKTQITK